MPHTVTTPNSKKRASAWTTDQLAAQLRAVFGSPPKMDKLEHWGAWDALHHQWAMRETSKEQLATLVSYAMASLPVHERLDASSTLANLRAFVDGRNRTVAFKTNLRAAFIRAHKRSQPTAAGPGHGRSGRSGLVSLHGGGVPVDREPYPHQLEARRRLDALMTRTKASERRGLIVLPTGAGKTSRAIWPGCRSARWPLLIDREMVPARDLGEGGVVVRRCARGRWSSGLGMRTRCRYCTRIPAIARTQNTPAADASPRCGSRQGGSFTRPTRPIDPMLDRARQRVAQPPQTRSPRRRSHGRLQPLRSNLRATVPSVGHSSEP